MTERHTIGCACVFGRNSQAKRKANANAKRRDRLIDRSKPTDQAASQTTNQPADSNKEREREKKRLAKGSKFNTN